MRGQRVEPFLDRVGAERARHVLARAALGAEPDVALAVDHHAIDHLGEQPVRGTDAIDASIVDAEDAGSRRDPDGAVAIFVVSALAIIPLAGLMGRATEMLAERLGQGVGGLLNATFGNAAELIIAGIALREGLFDLVKASITGSIIGNVLLVFGLSALLGGLRHPTQRFNRTAASQGGTLLVLSGIGLVVPAIFHLLVRGIPGAPEGAFYAVHIHDRA